MTPLETVNFALLAILMYCGVRAGVTLAFVALKVPQFRTMFDEMGIPLPGITLFFIQFAWPVAGVCVLIVVAQSVLCWMARCRRVPDAFALITGIVGLIVLGVLEFLGPYALLTPMTEIIEGLS